MGFSELLQAVRDNPQAVLIPAQWGQGRASFGGLVAALVYEAMRAQVSSGRPLRSLAMTFVGPAAPDVPVRFEVDVLREGKAVSQVLGRAIQDGQVVTIVQGSFGAGRESHIAVAAEPAPQATAVEACQELPYIPNVTPEFTRYLAMRWAFGGVPFSGNTSRDMGGWVRLRDQAAVEPVSEAHLLALVDAWPPAVLPHLSAPAPGSTLTWTIEFVQPMSALTTQDWCLYRAHIEHARDGYGHVAAAMWTANGELLAISRQTVAVFG
ncbi:acyl-CoA thioesterase II [Pseudomonas sp. HMWF032]|uniref:acyl-CoA thioesterase n=1 Tax=unclassified Pseudomonas TaxID=196821 RepID=UPI000D3CC6AF|nr:MULTISPECIES: thioesterase family protein [unclassified Pseudomonas]PTS86882.1 acyl-CoA thioesterase II [Pseudomonas sp. HMWF032]PTT81629.1 acyl-CoA thioesterase II [Pseudomonas sp. HMWF010]WAC44548.1 thioesterase family protein [Pseudomonas sp. SL4(2022)]